MNRIPHLAFVTSSRMPKPDPETHLLMAELEKLGAHAAAVHWDADLDWSIFDLVLIRTTWDYFERLDEFLTWVHAVEGVTRLRNSAAIIEWNAHKSYLLELAEAGVRIVPTILLRHGEVRDVEAVLAQSGFEEVVVKPAVSAGAVGTLREGVRESRTRLHIRHLLSRGDVLIQPFVPSIISEGESSLVFFNGDFSHAISKRPAPGDFRVQDNHGGTVHHLDPTSAELDLASAAIACAPELPLYARVDLVNMNNAPAVMELEIIEPELFLPHSPDAAARFAGLLIAIASGDLSEVKGKG